MAKIRAFVRTTKKELANIRFRLMDSNRIELSYTSNILINPEHWDSQTQEVKSKVLLPKIEKNKIDIAVRNMKNTLLAAYNELLESGQQITSEKLKEFVESKNKQPKLNNKIDSIFIYYEQWLKSTKVSEGRKRVYNVVYRSLIRFEKYCQITITKNIAFTLHNFTLEYLTKYEQYLANEHLYSDTFPQVFEEYKRDIDIPKGQNTIISQLKILRAFFNWAKSNEYTTNYPFKNYKFSEEVYATPYYLTIEERNKLYHTELGETLNIQRDIFVFQCLIGCRISDLLQLKKTNVINGAIEYIAGKKRDKDGTVLRVPLNSIALEIIDRYADYEGEKLLPFISEQKYNIAIKKAFTKAGITRIVTIINPLSRKQEQRPINELASSHLARRTFIGNLYKQIADPNLISSLSGHVEGSKAFARYRAIDEEMKKDLVNLLE